MARKDFDEKDWKGRIQSANRLAGSYGMDPFNTFHNPRAEGRYQNTQERFKDFTDTLVTKMDNDYDVRRSLEAAGNKAPQMNGVSNMNEAYDAYRFMRKTHEKILGNTGKFSGANDFGNVTNHWVDKQNNKVEKEAKPDIQTSATTRPSKNYQVSDSFANAMAFKAVDKGGTTDWDEKAMKSLESHKNKYMSKQGPGVLNNILFG
tara:strand:+ start:4926 stop:5540 length:615 start_codon:yes stop_codon:yes gene_type:complete